VPVKDRGLGLAFKLNELNRTEEWS